MGKRKDGHYIIKSPLVLELGKKYFGCPTMEGVGLENGGGSGSSGSHWERAELGDEAMTAADINEPKYSLFTLSLLEDSGWYKPDYSMADEIIFGYGEGCGFINERCLDSASHSEFCTEG